MTIVESRVKEGVLKLGSSGTELDFSCQVTNVRINSTYDDDGDALETLCGDMIPPGRKLGGRSLAGTFVQDWTATGSVTDYLYDHDLETVPFEYTPNATGPTLSGEIRLEVPGETYGGDVNTRITSDFEWSLVGELTRGEPTGGAPATGATAGTPGTWTPGGSTAPANAAGATSSSVVASPTTAWTTGQYVQGSTAGAGGEMYWNGTAWTSGRAS